MTAPLAPARAWTRVTPSRSLRRGQVLEIDVEGRVGVLWRGRSGVLGAAEAWCPHLGAHLAQGGYVSEDALVCPFHQWHFQPQGQCTAIGYPAARIPSQASAQAWQVREEEEQIWVCPPLDPPLHRRGLGQLPNRAGTFPEGWYKIAYCPELVAGKTHQVHYFGQDISLTRSASGTAHALLDAVPPKPLTCVESGGLVLAWYGAGEPTFPAPDFSAYTAPQRTCRRFEAVVASSLWDVAENPFDVAHLLTVHHLVVHGDPEVREDGTSLHLDFHAHFDPPYPLIGPLARRINVHTHVEGLGLGLATSDVDIPLLTKTQMIGCNTPIDDNNTEYTLLFHSVPHSMWRPHVRFLHTTTTSLIWYVTAIERLVWGRKQYLKNPCLTPGERGIGRFRRWAKQFDCV
ncbi:MAG: phenylpropionate dioxygenase-like ring-hydroxylating dioxygenase large terminal subunit [Myxococcota bacterium]|jgi:phenylpropionate dioxygenase-like ring-hydroxylating dioxygenase large terminal subunit